MGNGFVFYFQNIFDYAHALQMVIVSFCTVLVFTFPTKKKIFLGLLEWVILFAGFIALDSFFFALSSVATGFRGVNFPLSLLFLVMIYDFFFCRIEKRNKVILGSIFYSAVALTTEFIKDFCYLIVQPTGAPYVALAVIAVNLLNFATVFVLCHFTISKFKNIPLVPTYLILSINVLIIITTYVFTILKVQLYTDQQRMASVYTGIVGIILYLIVLSLYLMLYFMALSDQKLHILQVQQKMAEADMAMLKLNSKNVSDMQKIVHDTKNQYAYLSLLLENQQYDEMKAYLASLSTETVRPLHFINCGNPVIGNILNLEKAKVEENGLTMETSLNVPPVLPFSEPDLCSILANLIDNAIEASLKVPESKEPIQVVVSLRQEYLYIGITNPIGTAVNKEELLTLNTSKDNPFKHGYGTKIVKNIATKYNGFVNFSIVGNHFIAEAMLDLMKGEKA